MSVPDDVEARIADAPLSAHLATSTADRPHVAPVWYVYEDGSLWLFTGGRKLRNLRGNGRVAVSIERADPDGSVHWHATLLGTARVVDDEDRVAAVESGLARKYGYDGGDEDETDDDAEDGGDDGEANALVEVAVGSASLSVY